MECDLFLFAGQSNMAGRGITSPRFPEKAPECLAGAGYEFRAISDPTRLYPLEEPFGAAENNPEGIFEPGMKTGSLVTAFVNAYYEKTGVPIVGVSASKGGSSILQWQPDAAFGRDALERFRAADTFLRQQAGERECAVRHRFLLWCQGETDGDHGMSADEYIAYFTKILDAFLKAGIERCFLIQVGNFNADAPPAPYPLPSPAPDYAEIRRAQCMIAERNPAVTMVSTKFEGMLRRGLMKDAFHYFQQAYNEVGTEAGINTADFVLMRPNLNRR